MKTSSVLTDDERSYVEACRSVERKQTTNIIDRLVAKVERLEALLRRGTHPDDGMSRKWYDDVLAELEKP